jgi:hypothetical protein
MIEPFILKFYCGSYFVKFPETLPVDYNKQNQTVLEAIKIDTNAPIVVCLLGDPRAAVVGQNVGFDHLTRYFDIQNLGTKQRRQRTSIFALLLFGTSDFVFLLTSNAVQEC